MVRNVFLVALLWFNPLVTPLWGWGSKVHRLINDQAADLLPDSVEFSFHHHRNWLVVPLTDADQQTGMERCGVENLEVWDSQPWYAAAVTTALRDAFAKGELERAIVLAADLDQFVADGHQPLHTTLNYNGQDSGNDRIRARFKIYKVDRFLEAHTFSNTRPETIQDPAACLIRWLIEADKESPYLLRADYLTRGSFAKKGKGYLPRAFLPGMNQYPPNIWYSSIKIRRTWRGAKYRIPLFD